MNNDKVTLTYSLLQSFKLCRRKAKLRYWDNLVPLEKALPLHFGGTFASCLEGGLLVPVDRFVRDQFPEDVENRQRCLQMVYAYLERYGGEAWDQDQREVVFRGPIKNPATGRSAPLFELAGKIDRLVRDETGWWLLETKTAATISSDYLERLWSDFQVRLYQLAAKNFLGLDIKGVIYDICQKCALKKKEPETQAEFLERLAKLIAKSKTGKSSAKRQEGEDEATFGERVRQWYRDHPEAFHREQLLFTDSRIDLLEQELWDLHLEILAVQKSGRWYQNTAACHNYNRQCTYWPICTEGMKEHFMGNIYELKEPHEELR